MTSPLRMITWCVSSQEDVTDQLNGLDYEIQEVDDVSSEQLVSLQNFWGVADPKGFKVNKLTFRGFTDLQIRLVTLSTESEDGAIPSDFGLQCAQFFSDEKVHTITKAKKSNLDLKQLIHFLGAAEPQVSFLSIMADDYIEEVEFYTKVLGMSASLVEDHVVIFQNEDRSFYLHLDQDEDNETEPIVSRFPQLGWVMNSYETRDLGEILARAHASQNKVYRSPRKLYDPILGSILSLCLLSPMGMVVEVYQKA